MRRATRFAVSTFASLAIVVVTAGCSGSTWQFWKTSPSSPTSADATLAGGPPPEPTAGAASESTPAAPITPVSTAIPASPVAPPSVTAPSSRGFTELATLPEVRFRPGQVTLSRADLPTLERVVRWLKEHPEAEVLIEGHTDDLGTDEGNRIVGEKRAATIMQHLVAKGVEPDRISIVSLGSERPRCGEKTDACRAQNRRARVLVKQP